MAGRAILQKITPWTGHHSRGGPWPAGHAGVGFDLWDRVSNIDQTAKR
jgi:hypothetical protein